MIFENIFLYMQRYPFLTEKIYIFVEGRESMSVYYR